ncbi:MAG: asparagine synthase (glutamine-hydrolyzing) [Kiritimatiellae bacterium]|nr:asparagine synthase (glutamine-hydrolyzing) [Kiritimatiellia bacterium]
MCGICGVIKKQPCSEGDMAAVRAANAAMVHRGPDGEGEYGADHLFMAMRRLSIIDVEGGWQPLYNEDRSIALVANGEVYNFVELREELEALGHRFTTHSDCEVIAHLYEEHGLDFVHRLRGMYGVALWDSVRGRVVLVRDRMGEKPLYICEQEGSILFASEMQAMLATGRVPFELEPGAVCDYFHYEYVPEPRTAVKGVRKLPAGHMLVVDVKNWQTEETCYWRMEDAPPLDGDPKTLIHEQLEQIGDIILRSDVPLGVALSAGLDSSTVAALVAKKSPGQIHALTVGFEGGGWRDERSGARDYAEHLGMPFHDVQIPIGEVVDQFGWCCRAKDDPIADVASHGYHAVARLARENNIPVLLQGQGADEMYWGYTWLRRAMGASMRKMGDKGPPPPDYHPLRAWLPQNLHQTGLRDYAFFLAGKLGGWDRMPSGPADQLRFYDQSKTYQMAAYAAPRMFAQTFQDSLADHNPAALFTVPEPRPELGVLLTKLACETYLLENGMQQGDRLAMAHAIELRLPLVDYRLVETIIGLRKTRPDQHLQPKAWFREVIREYVPEWVLSRPKTGFSPPSSLWMNAIRRAYGQDLADGYLATHGVLDPAAARRMARPHSQLTAWPVTFYKAMVLEWWCRGMAAICP